MMMMIHRCCVSVLSLGCTSITNGSQDIWNLYCTLSEDWHGVRMKSWSGMKKPSSWPISSSNITPSQNWTQSAEFTTEQGRWSQGRGSYLHVSSTVSPENNMVFFFTCVSMSTTWRAMLDTSWLIKCKMAWKEKINRFTAVMGKHWFLQYHINKTTGKMAKRPLNPRQNSSFSTSQMISSPCYTCFTVLTSWASSFSSWSMGSSSGETEQP